MLTNLESRSNLFYMYPLRYIIVLVNKVIIRIHITSCSETSSQPHSYEQFYRIECISEVPFSK